MSIHHLIITVECVSCWDYSTYYGEGPTVEDAVKLFEEEGWLFVFHRFKEEGDLVPLTYCPDCRHHYEGKITDED